MSESASSTLQTKSTAVLSFEEVKALMPPEEVIKTGAPKAVEAISEANLTSIRRGTAAGTAQKNEIYM